MAKKEQTPKTRDEIFRKKAETYVVCYSTTCPLREHCLRSILSRYTPENDHLVKSINMNNPLMQHDDCPQYRSDEPRRMPVGLMKLYYDMPSRIERKIRGHLIAALSRKRYYEYRNGTRPIPPDVEKHIRHTLRANGWTQPPVFDGYADEYLW
jgi:hypothetical protein